MSEKHPIIVFASGNGSTFQAIVEDSEGSQVTMLLSDNRDAYALERARNLGVPTFTFLKDKTSEEIHQQFMSLIPAIRPQPKLIVLAGYMRILPSEFVQRFPRIINIHPSLLPKYKGLNTYRRALESGDSVHGTTVHQVTEDLDAGPILAQQVVAIREEDTEETLKDRTQAVERALYPNIIDQVLTGSLGWQD